MTGSGSDPQHYQPHVRNKPRRKALAERFKDPDDPLKLVIVRDMWLTGFDAPPLHTMYVDKPMHGHGLMQAIARVNRVYKDKPGGLIVDYLGIAPDLQEAIATYTASESASPTKPLEEAVDYMLDQFGIASAMFHGFDYDVFFTGTPTQRLSIIPPAMEHILTQKDGKKRYMDTVARLSSAFALAMPDEAALEIREEVAFFQAVRAVFAKVHAVRRQIPRRHRQRGQTARLDRRLVERGDQHLRRCRAESAEHLDPLRSVSGAAIGTCRRRTSRWNCCASCLNDEIKSRSRRNVVQARSFAALLEAAIQRYQNHSIDAAQVITELIDMAKEMREAGQRGEALGLSDDEVSFYDALAANESAVEVLGDKQLAFIAHELVKAVRANVTIDWSVKQNARAKIRVLVKRILRKYGYPPDLQEAATETVIEQAELLAGEWIL